MRSVVVPVLASIVTLIFSSPSLMAGEYDDVQVLSASSLEIAFVYRPGPLSWSMDEAGAYPQIPACAVGRLTGYPAIPGRLVYIAVPPGCQNVSATAERITARDEGQHPLTPDDLAAAVLFPYPEQLVLVDPLFTLRGLKIARLTLHPFTYESADGRYSVMGEMTIRVHFEVTGSLGAPPPGQLTDAFSGIFHEIILNADQVSDWRVTGEESLAKPAAAPDPFAGADHWLAISVHTGGVVRIIPEDLSRVGIDLAAVTPSSFRLFSGPGRQLSTRMSDPPPALTEIPILIRGGDDGRFDGADEIEFYAQGLNRWEMTPDGRLTDVVHRYDRDNVYWLSLDGSFSRPPQRLVAVAATEPSAAAPVYVSGRSRARHERDKILRVDGLGYVGSYYTWYWQNLRTAQLFSYAVDQAEPGAPARWEISAHAGRVRLLEDGAVVPTVNVPFGNGEDGAVITAFDLASFNPGARFDLVFDSSGSENYYLDYYSLDYQRRLTLASSAIQFASPDTNAVLTLAVADVTTGSVWDVTDSANPFIVDSLTRSGNVVRFGVDQEGGARHVYYAFEPSQRQRPSQVRLMIRPDLYAPVAPADYLVIGPRVFQQASSSFMTYRANHDGLSVRYVPVEDIYDDFSLGVADPVAIRRFLRYAYQNWPRSAHGSPAYALLLGDGTYDFLDNSGAHAVNYVPPYIASDDNSAADENYVYFGDKQVLNSEGDRPANPFSDMIIARWPVKNAAQIQAITSKITRYESPENLGPWRSRVMLVADDEFGDRERNSVDEDFHVRSAEEIAHGFIPSRFDLQKIYLTEYPFNNPGCELPAARGCRKPAAKEAIVAGLNDGVLVFDYIGHGNPDLLAHERVFERAVDLPRLTNAGMPTAALTFSCSIGFFDDPSSEGMSEEWLRMPDAGAVAVVSATRLVTAGANAALNEKVFDLLFNRQMTGIGAALYTGKVLRQYFANCTNCGQPPCPCPNDRRYVLFGDPAMKLGNPTLKVDFDSLQPETLSALSLTQVHGRITDSTGALDGGFNGALTVTVRDAPRQRIYRINDALSVNYDLAGGTLYRGEVAITGGRFQFGFVVPKDIAYGQRGATILGHASSLNQMAGGARDSLFIAGSSGVVTDTAGPQIEVQTADGRALLDGMALREGTELVAMMHDTSGINLTGAPGHSLEVFADEQARPLADLTGLFTYDPGGFRRGHAQFALTGLAKGLHRLRVKAWDNANNSSVKTIDLEISDQPEFRVSEFLNYPNPFSVQTKFYFRPAVDRATIRLFTLSGRLIRSLDGVRDGETLWDGTDQEGDPVGNGVYLAQIEITDRVAEGSRQVDKTAHREIKVVVSR